ncbi:lipid A export permease/ATP-binding protein MsbA [Moritella sp. 24]|uniref:lipid A export permease/ATP-binding protein MsbA n=1 Tax=Moritella sp. 24 TaxID=2746230 RepID=UPI001BF0434A|nr:lipid A export permease/ATP-binding protein MsbA [Moritella sp. 24]QUM76379.1 lipid A export permease/ATP-binding protein MsbA [Moritella sp. 24]
MDQQRTAWQTAKRFSSYVLDLKTTLFFGVIAMLGYGIVDATLLNILQPLVDEGFNAETSEFLKWMPLFVVGMITLRGLASFGSSYCMAKVGNTVVMRLQRQLFDHLMHLPVSFFDKTPSGELVSKIIYDSTQVSGAASRSLVNIFRSGAFIIGLLIWMFYQSWQLSVVLLFIAPVVGLIVNVVSRRFRLISRRLQQAMGNVSSTAQQMLHGQKDVLMFAGHETERERFGTVSNHIRQQQMKMATTSAASNALVQIVASFALGVVLYLASFDSIRAELTPGKFVAIVGSMMALLRPLRDITNINSEIQKAISACNSLFEILDLEIEKNTGTFKPARVKGKISFSNVDFTYPTATTRLIENMNFTAQPGEMIALVGRSGSGKSTLASLITRFYEIEKGQISIDDVAIHDFELKSLRTQIALVSQNVHLFNDSVAANIAYGRMAEVTREDIIEAATKANALEFIEGFEHGFDTMVGENGAMLSGGQRQRIAIARALLQDAPILILDEATSALDAESEKKVQEALERLQKDRTSLVIAHRLSTIEAADRILVIESGSIIESGSHSELLAKGEHYAQLHRLQLGG